MNEKDNRNETPAQNRNAEPAAENAAEAAEARSSETAAEAEAAVAAASESVAVLEDGSSNPVETSAEQPAKIQQTKRNGAPWPWIAVALLAVAALIFVLVRDNAQAAGGKNAVVGRMDGATFTKLDLYEDMVKQMPQGQAASALDNLMILKMIDLEAGKQSITVSDADINAEIAKYKKNFANDAEFNSALAQQSLTMESLKEQITISVKLRKLFEPQINPTEDQLKKYYEDNKAYYSTPEQIRASHILLKTKEEAEAVLAELKNGADFATLAKEKSIDTATKDNGGDLNYFGRGVMNEPFETAAFKLNKGELSGVVESPNGFHIIKVTDKKPAVTPTYDTVKQQVKNDYLDQEIQGKVGEWLTAKKQEYHFTNLLDPAAQNTAAPETAAPTAPAAGSAPASPSAQP